MTKARKRKVYLADYRCGCSGAGYRDELLSYCGKHGEPRRKLLPFGDDDDPEVREQMEKGLQS